MGLDPATLGMLLFGVGSGAVSGAMQPNPYQHRETFSGTGADPTSWLTDARGMLRNTIEGVVGRINEPVESAQVQPLGRYATDPRSAPATPQRPSTPGAVPGTVGRQPAKGFDINIPRSTQDPLAGGIQRRPSTEGLNGIIHAMQPNNLRTRAAAQLLLEAAQAQPTAQPAAQQPRRAA